MSAMEKMVAGMLGITPDEMAAMLSGFQDLLKNLGGKLDAILANQEETKAAIAALNERLDNVGSKPRKPAIGNGADRPGTGSPLNNPDGIN